MNIPENILEKNDELLPTDDEIAEISEDGEEVREIEDDFWRENNCWD